jgi:CheY-like chemotaxis protein
MINCMEKPILRSDLYRMLQQLSRQRKPKKVAAPVATPAPAPVAQNATLRQMRVLTAEDNRTNQLVFAKMVKDIDVDLRFVDNGREAVEMWRSFKPDLIFMDISMPEMDGKAAIRAIRAEEEGTGNRVPICALTAYAMEGENISILQAGADHYLTKPLKRAAISARIAAHQPSECRTPV